jgi:hypothetical protein
MTDVVLADNVENKINFKHFALPVVSTYSAPIYLPG